MVAVVEQPVHIRGKVRGICGAFGDRAQPLLGEPFDTVQVGSEVREHLPSAVRIVENSVEIPDHRLRQIQAGRRFVALARPQDDGEKG